MKTTKSVFNRTLIAAAIAAVSAGAFAADTQWKDAPTAEELPPVTSTIGWDDVKGQNHFLYTSTTAASQFLLADAEHQTFNDTLWVTGSGAGVQATGLWAAGEKNQIINAGGSTIYVTAAGGADSWSQHAMGAANGAIAINEGKIVANNAYGMFVGTDKNGTKAATIINNGQIYVETEGAAMELGGVDGSIAVNKGQIHVAKPADGKFGHGVLIQDQTDGVFVNAGLIEATEGASAIELKGTSTGNKIYLVAGSDVNGKINVTAEGKGNELYAYGTTDELDLAVAADAPLYFEVAEGANITLKNGNKSVLAETYIENATLNASIWQADNRFKSVEVSEGGVFNILKLNSGGTTDDNHTTLLLGYGMDVELDGGKLFVAGSEYHGDLKIGTARLEQGGKPTDAYGNGTLTIKSGSYNFKDVTVGKTGTIKVDSGNLTVNNLSFSKGQSNNTGKVFVNREGSFTINGTLTAGADGSAINLAGGSLQTSYKNFFTAGEDNKFTVKADNTQFIQGIGVLDLVDVTGDYSLQNLKDTQKQFGQGVQIAFSNGTLKLGEKEDLTGSSISGLALENVMGDATKDGAFNVKGNTTVAGVNFGEKQNASISADAVATLTLSGNNGNLFQGDVTTAEDGIVTTSGAIQLGVNSQDSGVVNVDALNVDGSLNVVGSFAAQYVSLGDEASLAVEDLARFEVSSLTGLEGSTAKVTGGVLSTREIGVALTVQDGGTLVLGAPILPDNPNARADVKQITGSVIVEKGDGEGAEGAVFTTNELKGTQLAAAVKDGAFDEEGVDRSDFNAVYIDRTVSVDVRNGSLNVGKVVQRGPGAVGIGSDVITVVDLGAFASGDVIFDAENGLGINPSGKGYVTNVLSEKRVTLVNAVDQVTGVENFFENDNAFLNVSAEKIPAQAATETNPAVSAHTDLVVKFNDQVTDEADLLAALPKVLAEGANIDNQRVLAAIGSKNGEFVEGDKLTTRGEDATYEYLAMPVTAGTYNVAYDAAEQVTGTIQRRNLEPSTGLGVWADVFYASNEAETMYGDSGYSADIYGGTIGFDGTFSCGAKLGLALSVGSGDADSEKSVGKYGNDADFWGVSIYTGKDIAGLYFSADASYLSFDNDITGSVAGASVKENIDSSVFTIGVRADMTVWDEGFKVVPHVGLRYTKIDVDDYRGLDSDSMDVFETPIGVKIAGDFEPSAGWTLTPSFDFTIVPQLGDKDVNTLIGDVDVLDNVYNSTLGVNASYGNFTFGLSYRYGFGTNDRSNNAFQARAAYAF